MEGAGGQRGGEESGGHSEATQGHGTRGRVFPASQEGQ